MISAPAISNRSVRTRAFTGAALFLALAFLTSGCAARGHIASPVEISKLKATNGLSASGKLTLSGPRGRFSARVVFGVAVNDSLRIEIPGGAGLRFLLIAHDGKLRADLPEDDAMFEGAASSAVMQDLFGIDLAPRDLVAALVGSPPADLAVDWRFEKDSPVQVTMQKGEDAKLSITLDSPELSPPPATAFAFGPPRRESWTLRQMSDRLGLVR